VDQRWLEDSYKAGKMLSLSDYEVKKYPGVAIHRDAISRNFLFWNIQTVLYI
jgi:hypothetical protein